MAWNCIGRTIHILPMRQELYSHGNYEFFLQPLSNVHLRSSFEYDVYGHTEPTDQYIRIFTLIAVLILLISVINYINLSTARSTIRAREVGVRKVFGARRAQSQGTVDQAVYGRILLSLSPLLFICHAAR